MNTILLLSNSSLFKKTLMGKLQELNLAWKSYEEIDPPLEDSILIFDLTLLTKEPNLLITLSRDPSCRILALSSLPNLTEGYDILKLGIKGYANLHISIQNLSNALNTIACGGTWYDPLFMNELIAHIAIKNPQPADNVLLDKLSEREHEVAQYVAQGFSNPKIAEVLGISERTVKAHLQGCYEKLRIHDRVSLALLLKRNL